jgi:hypothetical protein
LLYSTVVILTFKKCPHLPDALSKLNFGMDDFSLQIF